MTFVTPIISHPNSHIFSMGACRSPIKVLFCLNYYVFTLAGHRGCAIKSQNLSGESKTSLDGGFDRWDLRNNALNARFSIFLIGSTHKARNFQHFRCILHVRMAEKIFSNFKISIFEIMLLSTFKWHVGLLGKFWGP